jgi:hypothetical protein
MTKGGWRRELLTHGPAFLSWIEREEIVDRVFTRLAGDLEGFLLNQLDSEATAKTFVAALRDVTGRCNEDIYDHPLRAEAYAFVHLLERYRRGWRILQELTQTGDLPLARHGVRALDVGMGPAPMLYAIDDFYGALTDFSKTHDVSALCLPAPELVAIENSGEMQRFTHHFSEWARRTLGPFGAQWTDLADFDPRAQRAHAIESRVAQIAQEDDTSMTFARWWVNENEGDLHGLHTFRLCIFSNFLTTSDVLSTFQNQVEAALAAVTPGGVVLIVGSTHATYQPIYDGIQESASTVGLRRLDVQERFDPPQPDPLSDTIKTLYTNIWRRLEEFRATPQEPSKSIEDVWNPGAPYRNTPFVLRAYRRDGTHG